MSSHISCVPTELRFLPSISDCVSRDPEHLSRLQLACDPVQLQPPTLSISVHRCYHLSRLRITGRFYYMLASGTIYLLAPMMGENSVLSEGTYVDGMSSAIRTAAIPRNTEIAHTILRSLPYTIAICIVVSLLCAYFFSKARTNRTTQ